DLDPRSPPHLVRGPSAMASVLCRVQFLEDSDPFICTNFPEPRRPPTVDLEENLPLSEQIAAIHKLLEAPLKLEECTLQLSPNGNYLDLDSSLIEQKDELESFYEDVAKGKKPILILRTQLSVRVHSILEKLYNSQGPELRRSLFSLKQLFQDDKDLVPEFVASEGLTCFIKVGAEADHNYQNYILRALSQIMLFVDGMNGVINHNETVQWLYTLTGSLSRLVVKTSLKLLIVFVEYSESNGPRVIDAVNAVDSQRGVKAWSYLMEVLEERNGSDTELLIFAMTLINKTLAVLPDQDSFYDVTDSLEQLGMETIIHKHMNNKATEMDLRAQFTIYERALRYEDGEVDDSYPQLRKERRKIVADQEGRSRRRSSNQNLPDLLSSSAGSSPSTSPTPPTANSPLSPAISSTSSTPPAGLSRASSPLTSDPSSPALNLCFQAPAAATATDAPTPRMTRVRLITHNTLLFGTVLLGVYMCVSAVASVQRQCSTLSNDKKFLLDMLYSKTAADTTEEEGTFQPGETCSIDMESHTRRLETTQMTPLGPGGSVDAWDQLQPSAAALRIKDLDFSDLLDEEDIDVLDMDTFDASSSIPPPPPGLAAPPPPPPPPPPPGAPPPPPPAPPPPPSLAWREMSNAINIGMTVLPTVQVIKTAILNFDEFAISKEGIEKILTMTPTEEEKQRIQEAQLANPDVPLGTAEQFLFSLASISALTPRLQLWAFKLNYEALEKEIAEPLFDLKLGMEQLASNQTFRRILATLLAIGNFLNSSNAKGFELGYLEKVVEVKDTVHRQSLLHHTCNLVVENYPESSDVYSEIPAITRSAKVDFELLSENLVQLERRCKASWDNLKVVTKHETKAVLKNKMTDFLKDCTQKIIILKVVHRRVINRFHSFLLFLGQPSSSVRDIKVTSFCRIISEFALEYRTTRERVLTLKRKRAAHRERTKTRGKLITEVMQVRGQRENQMSTTDCPCVTWSSPSHHASCPLTFSSWRLFFLFLSDGEVFGGSLGRVSPSQMSAAKEDGAASQNDATDEIMDRLVKSVTQNPSDRASSPKTRKRSRLNRKSLRRTLKSGLSVDVVQALGLNKTEDKV
uniref:Formin homology 2 domain containing 1 n=1 Tax=Echeneis naucrates TaxID=173247 RepID=A0A665WUZ8_ECHNA